MIPTKRLGPRFCSAASLMIPYWINAAYILVDASALLHFAEDTVQILLYCSLSVLVQVVIFFINKSGWKRFVPKKNNIGVLFN